MKITRIINNNVVGSVNEVGKELVVMGKGIGFQKKVNDIIDESLIEKMFTVSDPESSQFAKLVEEIPYEQVKTAGEIISYAKQTLDKKLSKNIYITLTDHLSFAIDRKQQGIEFENALLWEIKRFYGPEYSIGLHALEIVKERLGVELSKDEAGFLALHLVNAEVDGDIRTVVKSPEMIQDILNIVKYSFGIELDENTIAFERFLTHLKFFIQRAIKKNGYHGFDEEFYGSILNKYVDATKCARKIKDYMKKKLDYEVSDEELTYLSIHIERIVRRETE